MSNPYYKVFNLYLEGGSMMSFAAEDFEFEKNPDTQTINGIKWTSVSEWDLPKLEYVRLNQIVGISSYHRKKEPSA